MANLFGGTVKGQTFKAPEVPREQPTPKVSPAQPDPIMAPTTDIKPGLVGVEELEQQVGPVYQELGQITEKMAELPSQSQGLMSGKLKTAKDAYDQAIQGVRNQETAEKLTQAFSQVIASLHGLRSGLAIGELQFGDVDYSNQYRAALEKFKTDQQIIKDEARGIEQTERAKLEGRRGLLSERLKQIRSLQTRAGQAAQQEKAAEALRFTQERQLRQEAFQREKAEETKQFREKSQERAVRKEARQERKTRLSTVRSERAALEKELKELTRIGAKAGKDDAEFAAFETGVDISFEEWKGADEDTQEDKRLRDDTPWYATEKTQKAEYIKDMMGLKREQIQNRIKEKSREVDILSKLDRKATTPVKQKEAPKKKGELTQAQVQAWAEREGKSEEDARIYLESLGYSIKE